MLIKSTNVIQILFTANKGRFHAHASTECKNKCMRRYSYEGKSCKCGELYALVVGSLVKAKQKGLFGLSGL